MIDCTLRLRRVERHCIAVECAAAAQPSTVTLFLFIVWMPFTRVAPVRACPSPAGCCFFSDRSIARYADCSLPFTIPTPPVGELASLSAPVAPPLRPPSLSFRHHRWSGATVLRVAGWCARTASAVIHVNLWPASLRCAR